ncbi:hypothetical protein Rt10032_c03g1586 [Rhodotorula toruloides]|uniref:Uncharacterized protein n=1 Tax=Rhodotorula toruloides TaxID=5286 RepID=A0A511KB40_RHOTO|nr:hypothetical protein Rt10032_c03g1586 [Rhodotorula toruloides]
MTRHTFAGTVEGYQPTASASSAGNTLGKRAAGNSGEEERQVKGRVESESDDIPSDDAEGDAEARSGRTKKLEDRAAALVRRATRTDRFAQALALRQAEREYEGAYDYVKTCQSQLKRAQQRRADAAAIEAGAANYDFSTF